MYQLERQMKRICALCEERQALAQKDRQLYNGEQICACNATFGGFLVLIAIPTCTL